MEVDRGEDEFFLFGGWEDFIEVDGYTQGDEKEATNARADPIGWLEGWWSHELGPKGGTSLSEKDSIFV